MFRAAIDVLREAGGPLETRELAMRLPLGRSGRHGADGGAGSEHDRGAAAVDNHEGKTVERAGEGVPVKWMLRESVEG
jgi:hypothetical protein